MVESRGGIANQEMSLQAFETQAVKKDTLEEKETTREPMQTITTGTITTGTITTGTITTGTITNKMLLVMVTTEVGRKIGGVSTVPIAANKPHQDVPATLCLKAPRLSPL